MGARKTTACATAATLLAMTFGTASAQAQFDPPPPPNCPLDPPDGLICAPGPKATYVFEGAAANTANPTTKCEITLEDAVPADQEGTGRVQWRTRSQCDRILQVVTIDTKLLNTQQAQVGTGNTGHCHVLATDPNCGLTPQVSGGDVSGLPVGEYTQVATVRLVLREPGAPDPWVVSATPGAANPTACLPGDFEVICELRLSVTIDDPDAGSGFGNRTVDQRVDCTRATVENLPGSTLCAR
jgi:hypothetical protein